LLEAAIFEIVNCAPVLLVRTMVLLALLVLTAWFAKLKVAGENATVVATPVPVKVTL
jgi:hypothetical protein